MFSSDICVMPVQIRKSLLFDDTRMYNVLLVPNIGLLFYVYSAIETISQLHNDIQKKQGQ